MRPGKRSERQPETEPRLPAQAGRHALALWALLFCVYHANLGYLSGKDAAPNIALPVPLLNGGGLSFAAAETPALFKWWLVDDEGRRRMAVRTWDSLIEGEPASDLFAQGKLRLGGAEYFLTESVGLDEYINYYGPGAGLAALPLFAPLHIALGDLNRYPNLLQYAAKSVASAAVAGAAAILFLTASLYLRRSAALCVGLAYGLGTIAWSSTSQMLWQQAPTALFLSAACYFLARSREHWRMAAACGLAAGLAVLCRPTSFVLVLAAGGYLLIVDPRRLVPYVAGGLPVAVTLALYNATFLGAPWRFAQITEIGEYALRKTGSDQIWAFDFLTSVPGLIFSPSRGLLVYSPFLVFALLGIARARGRAAYGPLWPILLAFLATSVIQLSWYDWWGGWSYGYRPLADASVYLCVLIIPALEGLNPRRPMGILFALLLAWSMFVHGIGAFAFTGVGWNNRTFYQLRSHGSDEVEVIYRRAVVEARLREGDTQLVAKKPCNIDEPRCRGRLWSWRDSQILFHVREFDRQREIRRYSSRLDRIR